MTHNEVILANIISNLVAIVLVLLSWRKKNLARICFAVLFIWAAVVNWKTAHNNPTIYLEYEQYATEFYKTIIRDYFSQHIYGYVSMIAIAQLIIGLGFLGRGIIVKCSCIGGIIFLICIAPLGMGAAFPFSIITAIALYKLYTYNFTMDIFKNKWFV